MGLRASDAQIEEVTSVYVDKARQEPTPQPPPVAAPAADIASTLPSMQAPVLPATATPLPAARPSSATATPTAVHTRAPAHSNPHAHGAHALAPTPVVPVGKEKRVAEYHAVRVAVQPATSPGMYLVRALRSDEKAPAGTREAMLVPTHPEDEFAV
jgi:hypothetical protein